MGTAIVKSEQVQVGSTVLEALRADGTGWVVVKPLCDELGIDRQAQQRRLQRSPWATGAIMALVAKDGKVRDMYCLRADCVGMFLVTIEAAMVKDDAVRAKLVELQCRAAEVLDRWLRGTPAPIAALPGKVEPLLFLFEFPGEPVGRIVGQKGEMELTTEPGAFWRPGIICWVAEPVNVLTREHNYLTAESAKLIRRATEADLATAHVYFSGLHKFNDGTKYCTSTMAPRRIWAFGEARINAHGRTIFISASDNARVVAHDCTVGAGGNAEVLATDWSRVHASGDAVVHARDYGVVHANGNCTVYASGQVVVKVENLLASAPTVHLTDQAVRLDYDRQPTTAKQKLTARAPRMLTASPLALSA